VNTYSSFFAKSAKRNLVIYAFAGIALLAAFILTIISWLELCSHACAASHDYRLYGFKIVSIGFIILPLLLTTHLLSRYFKALETITGWMICAALGSEFVFIYIQKYEIGHWCPVCLGIAAALLIAGSVYFSHFYGNFRIALKRKNKGQLMHMIYKGCIGSCFFLIGFIFAFIGIGTENQLQAEENTIKERIAFGDPSKPIAVYIFTDWRCPACRSLEPMFEQFTPTIMSKATVTFVDDPVHPDSLNFTPYNLSFMANNKSQYLALRGSLTQLSEETKAPTDAQINAIAQKHGTNYAPISFSDVAVANRYFEELIDTLNVEGTPTVVIVNKQTHKNKRLGGIEEVTEENILKAINNLSKAKAKE